MNNLKPHLVWVSNSDINRQKWDACIDKCEWGNVYALSWFLDLMTDNQWDAIVLGDYEKIMPIPFRQKYGINYAYRPNFCQQLGVFSRNNELPPSVLNGFIEEICKKYKQIHYPLNHFNDYLNEKGLKLTKRTNFLLNLNSSYEEIQNNYSDTLKKNLKTAAKADLQILKNIEPNIAIALHKRAWDKFVSIPEQDYLNFIKISEFAVKNDSSETIGVYKDNQLLGACILLKYKNKIYYPFSAVSPEGRKYSAVAFLINKIIEDHSGKNIIFDFEGSDIATVKTFYKRFNPITETYFQIEKSNVLLNKASKFVKKISALKIKL